MTAAATPKPDAFDPDDFPAAVLAPHDHALTALDSATLAPLAAVAWCSAHLVAVDRVLYPAVQRSLPNGSRRVRDQRIVDHRLQQALSRLDRRLTGDTHLSAIPVEELSQEVRTGLQAHAEAEQSMVAELRTRLGAADQERLCRRLAKAMQGAPTRPHPYSRHLQLGGVVSSLEACVDRFRDMMDNRIVPTPQRTRVAHLPGRWGCYLMGTPYPSAPKRADTDSTTQEPRS